MFLAVLVFDIVFDTYPLSEGRIGEPSAGQKTAHESTASLACCSYLRAVHIYMCVLLLLCMPVSCVSAILHVDTSYHDFLTESFEH